MSISVVELIHRYQLQEHPEGGYYKENYRAKEYIPHAALPKKFKDSRNYYTAIYFLLEQGDFSAFHRLHSDECWHFYSGDTLLIHIIHLNGQLETVHLGSSPTN